MMIMKQFDLFWLLEKQFPPQPMAENCIIGKVLHRHWICNEQRVIGASTKSSN